MRTCLLVLFAVLGQTCNAQVKIDSLGHVGINAPDTLGSTLCVGMGGSQDITIAAKNKKRMGMYLFNSPSAASGLPTGMMVRTDHTRPGIGIWARNLGVGDDVRYSVAVSGQAEATQNAIGISGTSTVSGAGVYGSSGFGNAIIFSQPGKYAGYFSGDVKVTGKLYGTLYATTASSTDISSQQSDDMEKTRMHVESDEENVLEKLTSVPTVQFTEFVEDASQNGKTGIATQNYISDKAREMQRKAYQNPR